VFDPTEMLRRIADQIEASEQRCIASHHIARQTYDLMAMSREVIARSRDQCARLRLETLTSRSTLISWLAASAAPSACGCSRRRIYLRRRQALAGALGSDLSEDRLQGLNARG